MCSFKSIYFVIFILNLYRTHGEISDKRLCADPNCNEPVSLAKTLLRYSSPDPRLLSFAPNVEVKIYSKEAGSETSLWGAEIKGKRGYIPKHLVRELKVYKKPTFLVDTELKQKPQVPQEVDRKGIEPDAVKEPYEVVDGTTIYLSPQENIKPSSSEAPRLSTSLPSKENLQNSAAPEDPPKEKETTAKDSTQESVVNNVLSSFSDWVNDDEDSKEIDADDEDEDDENDDEEEEEDSLEDPALTEDSKNRTNIPQEQPKENMAQDLNSLHNLPPGIKLSSYGLEVDHSVNGTLDIIEVERSNKPESSGEEIQDKNVAENPTKIDSNSEKTITLEKTELSKKETINVNDEEKNSEDGDNSEATSKAEPVPNKNSEPMQENVENVSNESVDEVVGSVTEPSINIDDELPPILDETTTANPFAFTEQNDLKAESISSDESSETAEGNKDQTVPSVVENDKSADITQTFADPVPTPPDHPKEDIKSNDGGESLPSATLPRDIAEVTKLEDTEENSNASPSDDYVKDDVHSTVNEKEDLLPPLNIFNPSQNVLSEGSKETEPVSGTLDNADSNEQEEQAMSSEAANGDDLAGNEILTSQNEGAASLHSNTIDSTEVGGLEQNQNESVDEFRTSAHEDKLESLVEANKEEEVKESDTDELVKVSSEEPETFEESNGIWSGLFSLFGGSSAEPTNSGTNQQDLEVEHKVNEPLWVANNIEKPTVNEYCDSATESCNTSLQEDEANLYTFLDTIGLKFNSDFFILLITTAGSVILLLFVYMALDRHRREAPLISRINKLEKELLVTLKENELLQEKGVTVEEEAESVPNEIIEQLTQRLAEAQFSQQALQEQISDLEKQLETKAGLEEQIENLEKELETSTEVGMELNRIISEMLDPTNGSEKLKENVEQFHRQLLEQKGIINSINETLHEKEVENRMLRTDLERSKKVAADLQGKVDEMVEKILRIEKEKDQQQDSLQNEIVVYQQKYNEAIGKEEVFNNEIQIIKVQLVDAQRQADLKTKEYQMLKETLNKMKSLKNDSAALTSLLDSTSIKAEIQQLKAENSAYAAQLQQEQAIKVGLEKKCQELVQEMSVLREKFQQADKEKVEINSKLEVLNNYFKKRESELQEEIIKYKAIWDAKEGEATSTTERIKYMQEEIENYKAQNETLKQEIISQEIDLKSQISMLEKKVHENWVTARQTERKLEDARQEAAQLRNRLTLRERAINEERIQNRLQSPAEQNGELPLSPHPMDSPASPPLLYGGRDHITKSPPLPGLPPFLPPPPGAPFMPPPPHGMPPFMPPPPSMFPGDHRPPPLGRMSSPPLNSRYSPDTSAFSPYDRNSPSPPYDSEYGASPPPIRGYSPYSRDDRRDYKRPPHGRMNGRNAKGSVMSSGSDHSNDSLDKVNRKQLKKV